MSSRGGAGGRGGRGRGGRGGGRGAKFAHIPGADRPQFGNNAPGGSTSLAGTGPAMGGFEFSRVPEPYPPLQVDPPPEATADEEELLEIADTLLAEMQQQGCVPVVARFSTMKKPGARGASDVDRPKISSLGLAQTAKRSLSMADLMKLGEMGADDADGAGDDEANDDDDDENKIEDDDWEEDDADDDDYNAEKYWNDDDDRGDDDDAGGEAAF
ncbi:hypothetical protein BCR44DRAFT_1446054 [Catenaria anguillulae PL171]|uniref:Uncharacterized protein n=1 Tax=Catenaria anguillulae PL171 TaxID=765915 RepID=A0A1Y2H800_9FUNG|nr:hypothetical protein BCR44DRAFT_1446054 [Catenaria anguillulae PL171]